MHIGKIEKLSLFIIILLCFTVPDCKNQKRILLTISETRGVKFLAPSNIVVPDSLGGGKLIGICDIKLLITKDNKILDRYISLILAGFDRLHIVRYAVNSKNTVKGDSLYKQLSPWINAYINTIEVDSAKKSILFSKNDTTVILITLEFNYDNSKYPEISSNFEIEFNSPKIEYLDTSHYEVNRGDGYLDIFLDTTGQILSSKIQFIRGFSQSDTLECELVGRENTDKEIAFYLQLKPAIDLYVQKLKSIKLRTYDKRKKVDVLAFMGKDFVFSIDRQKSSSRIIVKDR
jgi:hypothetical protein